IRARNVTGVQTCALPISLGIGLLPTYETAGVWAPILLVGLRLVQGFAAGGEWGGAALFGLENAPSNRRGFWSSFTSMGIGIGTRSEERRVGKEWKSRWAW